MDYESTSGNCQYLNCLLYQKFKEYSAKKGQKYGKKS